MLDPASLERLSEFPERNDPLLNLALAEEGGPAVLLALARCVEVDADALAIVASRLAEEREARAAWLGRPSAAHGDDESETSARLELERRLIAHPNTPGPVRDALLAEHADDPFFVWSAGTHAAATELGLRALALWPCASPLHDRPWIAELSIDPRCDLLRRWASADDELLREAAARLALESAVLEPLSRDRSRRVRRSVASNGAAIDLRGLMAETDSAHEVRARALRVLAADPLPSAQSSGMSVQSMRQGGVLSDDVRQALVAAGPLLDEEGALLAARYLGSAEVCSLVAQAASAAEVSLLPRTIGVGAGLGLRRSAHPGSDEASLTTDIVHAMTRTGGGKTRLTGKARLALFVADCLSNLRAMGGDELARALAPGTLASDRMVFFRCASREGFALHSASLLSLAELPASVVELCWRKGQISDDDAVALCARAAAPSRESRELPEDELDIEPLARPLAALERAVLAAIGKTAVSPRAALAAIALEPRRCRYVLTAMPSWKGPLTGARLARVLKSHAGALSAAARTGTGSVSPGAAGTSAREAKIARWTERPLSEAEAAIAMAVGDLTVTELLRRLTTGSIRLEEGASLAAGIEARAAIEGRANFEPLVDHVNSRRTKSAAALSLWLLLENIDRTRASSLIASAVEGLSEAGPGTVVVPNVCEALATLERRTPGRLEQVNAQSPRGRATIASAIARAYRAVGGMRDEGF